MAAERCLCGRLAFETRGEPRWVSYCLDEPEPFEPQGHVFFAERIPWFDTRDQLPRK